MIHKDLNMHTDASSISVCRAHSKSNEAKSRVLREWIPKQGIQTESTCRVQGHLWPETCLMPYLSGSGTAFGAGEHSSDQSPETSITWRPPIMLARHVPGTYLDGCDSCPNAVCHQPTLPDCRVSGLREPRGRECPPQQGVGKWTRVDVTSDGGLGSTGLYGRPFAGGP